MPIPYNTDATIAAQVASELGVTVAALLGPGNWGTFITAGNQSGNHDIVQILLGRNYSPSDIDTCDQIQSYTLDQAVWRSLKKGGIAGQLKSGGLEDLDRREDAKTVILTTNNGQTVLVPTPGGNPVGGIDSGENVIHKHLEREYSRGLGTRRGGFYGGGGGY